MFIGRERELSVLRDHYNSQRFECVGIYGRRRVGKTSLISEFVRELPYIVALDEKRTAMVAECKWRGAQTSADQLLKLDARASLANGDATTL